MIVTRALEAARRGLHGASAPSEDDGERRPLWLTLRSADGRTKASVGTLAPSRPPVALAAELARELLSLDPRCELTPVEADDTLECCVGGIPRTIRTPAELSLDEALIVERAPYAGVLLPADAARAGFDAEARLVYVCRLAGLAGDAWEEPGTRVRALPVEVATGPVGAGND